MVEVRTKFVKSFIKVMILFVILLIGLEFVLYNYFILRISDRIEKQQKIELVQSWNNYYQQVCREFNMAVHGYAWWDELADAYRNNDEQKIVQYFENEKIFQKDYDLVLTIDNQNRFVFGFFKGQRIYKNSPEAENLLSGALQSDYSMLVKKDYRLNIATQTATDTIFSHIHFLKGEPVMISVSPVCNNSGVPVSNGYLVFGKSLFNICRKAEKIIPARIRFSTESFPTSYAQNVITADNFGESFYISLDPYYKTYPVLKEAMLFFIVIQIAFVTLLFAVALPLFTRRQTKYLNKVILERTQKIGEMNEELTTANQELLSALANIRTLSGFLPICSSCKKIRNDQGYWNQVESFIQENSEIVFSHSLCPNCIRELYPEMADKILAKKTLN